MPKVVKVVPEGLVDYRKYKSHDNVSFGGFCYVLKNTCLSKISGVSVCPCLLVPTLINRCLTKSSVIKTHSSDKFPMYKESLVA